MSEPCLVGHSSGMAELLGGSREQKLAEKLLWGNLHLCQEGGTHKVLGAGAAEAAGEDQQLGLLPLGREHSKTPKKEAANQCSAPEGQSSSRDRNPGRETRPWESMQMTLITEFRAHLLCRKQGCQQG